MQNIEFNRPFFSEKCLSYAGAAFFSGKTSGDGPYTKKCCDWFSCNMAIQRSLLVHSGTAALEAAALLLDIKAGDEVIMPSFTFVSTANAFALRGARPVFVDIRKDTLNIDEVLLEQAITDKTKAIVIVHYAGISCNIDAIMDISQKYGIPVVEDAAQCFMSKYKGAYLGTFGRFGAYSFHETKNLGCGEGGLLLVNSEDDFLCAQTVREKGTNRTQFLNGLVDKYTWQSLGSSYLPSDILAAILYAQLGHAEEITRMRVRSWNFYNDIFKYYSDRLPISIPFVPECCEHNGHIYYILLDYSISRSQVLADLKAKGVSAVPHYVALHSSPIGSSLGRCVGDLQITTYASECIIRLPLWAGISEAQMTYVVECLVSALQRG